MRIISLLNAVIKPLSKKKKTQKATYVFHKLQSNTFPLLTHQCVLFMIHKDIENRENILCLN